YDVDPAVADDHWLAWLIEDERRSRVRQDRPPPGPAGTAGCSRRRHRPDRTLRGLGQCGPRTRNFPSPRQPRRDIMNASLAVLEPSTPPVSRLLARWTGASLPDLPEYILGILEPSSSR